jgi:hypothetical protein
LSGVGQRDAAYNQQGLLNYHSTAARFHSPMSLALIDGQDSITRLCLMFLFGAVVHDATQLSLGLNTASLGTWDIRTVELKSMYCGPHKPRNKCRGFPLLNWRASTKRRNSTRRRNAYLNGKQPPHVWLLEARSRSESSASMPTT